MDCGLCASTTRILLAFAIAAISVQDSNDRERRWQEDLDELGRVISERHKSPFFKIGREEFFRAIEGVRKRIPELKDHQLAVEIMKLTAMIGDGHTGVYPQPEAAVQLRRFPIRAIWLKDGLFIVAAPEEHKDLLKARIVAVGKTPIEEAARRVAAVAAADNASGYRNSSAHWLTVPEILAGVGLIDDLEKVAYTIKDSQGQERAVEVAMTSKAGPWRFGVEKELPVSRRLQRARYGTELLAESKSVYAWYDSCADLPDRPVSAWCEEVLKRLDSDPPARLIVDLRRNGGGNSSLIAPLMKGLRSRPGAAARGKLFVLIDRPTYSSALLNALEFRRDFKAILVGLPPGSSPNHYGEIRFLTLPNCKWRVQYSTKYFKMSADEGDTLKPDIEVDCSAEEYFNGGDPALEAAIKYRP